MSDGSTNELLGETVETLKKLLERLEPWKMTTDAPKAPPQTAGQRIAERMIEYWPAPSMTVVSDFTDPGCFRLKFEGTTSSTYTLRQYVAAAIDKAIADERSECLAITDRVGHCGDGVPPAYYEAACHIAQAIRSRQ